MTSFADLGIDEALLQALSQKGFTEPTPIQQSVIPQILSSSTDVIALASTGTGKTAAFGLPLLQKIDLGKRRPQALILSPTRELAQQIHDDLVSFGQYQPGLSVVAVYGGEPISPQITRIKQGAQVIVGTPGRTLDLLNRGVLQLQDVHYAVLDEADEMLNMGFLEDITQILESVPPEAQSLLFSATMSPSIERIAQRFMRDPQKHQVAPTSARKTAIEHQYMMVPARDKLVAFLRYHTLHPEMYGILFCRTRRETQEIGDALLRHGLRVGVLHGEIEQRHRTRIMDSFRNRETTLLVATDVAARGIDVAKLTHVIHYGLPDHVENYVHRSGRTGRAQESGVSLVIAHLREHRALDRIEREQDIAFTAVEIPRREDMIMADLRAYQEQLASESPTLSTESQKATQALLQSFSPEMLESVLHRALALGVQERVDRHPEEEIDRYKPSQRRSSSASSQRKPRSKGNMQSLTINFGRKDRLTVPHLLGMINDVTRGQRVDIGRIVISESSTTFQAPTDKASLLTRKMTGKKRNGKTVKVSLSPKS